MTIPRKLIPVALVATIIMICFLLFVYSPYAYGIGGAIMPEPPNGWNSSGTVTATESFNGDVCVFTGNGTGYSVGCRSYAFSGLLRIHANPIYALELWLACTIFACALSIFFIVRRT